MKVYVSDYQGDDHKFVPFSEGYVDYGYLYAASTFTDHVTHFTWIIWMTQPLV